MNWKLRFSVMGAFPPVAFFFVFLVIVFAFLLSGCAAKTSAPTAQLLPMPTYVPRALPKAEPLVETNNEEPREETNTEESIDPGLPVAAPLKAAKIVIEKAQKKLFLYSEEKLLRIYPVKLGLNPVGDKLRQGDKRTPEGTYYICTKNPRSKYHLSLGLSYPSIEDAARGLEQKLITQRDHDRILQKITKKAIPPWDTPLGGEIFIHGGGETWDWTYGCVALRIKDIEELFKVISVGTEVVIRQ